MYILKTTANFNSGSSETKDYNSLENKPQINSVELIGNVTLEQLNIQQNMDITSEDITNWNNKSDFSGNYDDLSNKPDLSVYQNVQANWNETDTSSDAYIQNKPTIPSSTSDLTNDSDFTTKTYVDGLVGNIETVLTTITTGGGVS